MHSAVIRRYLPGLSIAAICLLASACSPPPPTIGAVNVSAASEHWQSQVTGESESTAIHVERGDRITVAIDGSITYGTKFRGLKKKRSGPWGTGEPNDEHWCPEARIGALVWRIGSDGPCSSLEATTDMTFIADRDGDLQFMVNDRQGRYGDNSDSFHVTVTVQPD
jgi:hypothetical protein